jgi:hypothetical protein
MLAQQTRLADLSRFYDVLGELEQKLQGMRGLSECKGSKEWPGRGVYFFFEKDQHRSDTGSGNRVVRVGTHALKAGSRTTLWKRLYQHKGQKNGNGNHRGSIFRLLVGTALINSKELDFPDWGKGNSAPKVIREQEQSLERQVSDFIGNMLILYLPVNDEPGRESLRGYIERNAIAMLSNYNRAAIDSTGVNWLGYQCDREKVRKSGLWNQNHVDEIYDPDFIRVFDDLVSRMDF